MAEQTLKGVINDLVNWVEFLHQNNLKYQAQIKELEARLTAVVQDNNHLNNEDGVTNRNSVITVPTMNSIDNQQHIISSPTQMPNIHPQHQQGLYQPLTNHSQPYNPQPMACMWTPYNPNGHYDMQFQYHDPGYAINPYQQPTPQPQQQPQPQTQQQQQQQRQP